MKPIFRNAMFGFHKEDVAHFIAKQNKHRRPRQRSRLNRVSPGPMRKRHKATPPAPNPKDLG